MEHRAVDVILEDWRAIERELDAAQSESAMETLQARVLQLRDEYRAALAARVPEAEELRHFALDRPVDDPLRTAEP